MKKRMVLFVLVLSLLSVLLVQAVTLKSWVAAQTTTDTVKLLKLTHKRPITGWNDWDEVVNRDKFRVQAEKFAKNVAIEAGIVKTDTLAQMDTKLQAMINSAAAADKPIAVYKANAFWTAYFVVQTVEGSGNGTVTISHHDPVYGQSPAQANGWGAVTGKDIEKAVRAK